VDSAKHVIGAEHSPKQPLVWCGDVGRNWLPLPLDTVAVGAGVRPPGLPSQNIAHVRARSMVGVREQNLTARASPCGMKKSSLSAITTNGVDTRESASASFA
jgi:hypothetical protein